jgi:tetratricopeptide (TPR) repeat protein
VLRVLVFIAAVFGVTAAASGQAIDARFHFPGQAAAGSVATGPRHAETGTTAEQALWADAADGRLDREPLIAAALVASGVDSANDRDGYLRRFEHWVAELKVSGRVTGTPRDRAAAIHEFLHERAFRGGFRDTSTSLVETFEHGRFNCISSVILFLAVAERFALPAHGVEVPAHAYAVVDADAGPIVVQTTCRAWFAAEDAALQEVLLRRTLGDAAGTAAAERTTGRRLNDVGLLAVVYYNRGVDQLEAGHFAEAAAANRTAIRLDSSNSAARANLLATINNWSLDLGRRGQLNAAVRLLEEGLSVAPEYGLFHENLVALHQQRLSGAVATSGESAPSDDLVRCYRRWRAELIRRGAVEEANAVDRRAAGDPFMRSP